MSVEPQQRFAENRNGVRIVNKLVNRVELMEQSSCDCDKCKSLCKSAPGIGTPAEMQAIRDAGLGHKLLPTAYLSLSQYGIPVIDITAPKMTEQGCAFLDELGRCELHDKGLKPLECRLQSHALSPYQTTAITLGVFRTWLKWNDSIQAKILNHHPLLREDRPNILGNRESCSCNFCVACCENKPGWFDYGEAEKAAEYLGLSLEEFFRTRLSVDAWHYDADMPDIFVLSPATVDGQNAGKIYGWKKRGRCTFLTKEGRCEIHPVKPSECKRACHDNRETGQAEHHRVRDTWNNPEAQAQIGHLLGSDPHFQPPGFKDLLEIAFGSEHDPLWSVKAGSATYEEIAARMNPAKTPTL